MGILVGIYLFALFVLSSPFLLSGDISREEDERELMDIVTRELS